MTTLPKDQRRCLVRCKFRRSDFAHERQFILGAGLIGVAFVGDCFGPDMTTLLARPAPGEFLPGFVAGLTLGSVTRDRVRVALPDGCLYDMRADGVFVERQRDPEWIPLVEPVAVEPAAAKEPLVPSIPPAGVHVPRDCKCNEPHCMFCDGGLFECVLCGSFEGATTTECPAVQMTADQIDRVYAGTLDFINGQWREQASASSPAYYAGLRKSLEAQQEEI